MTSVRNSRASKNDEWIEAIRSRVLRWGRRNFARYPWREESDPWLTLVAELLLQRTRAAQAIRGYEYVRDRYRSPRKLLRTRRGALRALTNIIGLHGRAETLVAVARSFARDGVPVSAEALRAITGIGDYTAAAWLSLHRSQRHAIVDSNVFRWLGRMTGKPYQRDPRHVRWVSDLAHALTPRRSFRDYNYAVLDFTMTICTPRDPKCARCPLVKVCVYGRAALSR